MSDQKKQKESALGMVLLRNSFYKDSYKRVLLGVILVVVINLLLSAAIVYKIVSPVSPNYFPATSDGRLIKKEPLTIPVHTNSFVEQWAADSLMKSFRLDFVHWRAQLAEAKKNFTPQGWKWFVDSLEASNNLNTLRGSDMVSSIRITSAPKVVRNMIIGGSYMWMVKMKVMLTYKNINRTINAPNEVTMIVVRETAKDYPDRVAVNNIIMKPIGNTINN
jgi:intracellular multiplication protein IcmL